MKDEMLIQVFIEHVGMKRISDLLSGNLFKLVSYCYMLGYLSVDKALVMWVYVSFPDFDTMMSLHLLSFNLFQHREELCIYACCVFLFFFFMSVWKLFRLRTSKYSGLGE